MKQFEGTLILSDLDGTLLDEDSHISVENRAAIDDYIDNGGLFSIATGRSKAGMEHFFPELRINAPAILYNGSVVYDFARQVDLFTAPVGEAGLRLALALREDYPYVGVEVYAEHLVYAAQDSQLSRRHFASVKIPWNQRPAEAIPQPWLSLVLTCPQPQIAGLEQYIEARFRGQFFLQRSSHTMLEVMRRDANKGSAALLLRDALGIPPEGLYTVGDGPNDIQLLQCTENSCAPENACPAALAQAAHRLPHHAKHAIAALIAQLAPHN